MTNYLLDNWLAIIALFLSIANFAFGIYSWQHARKIQFEEQYNLFEKKELELFFQNAQLYVEWGYLEEEYNKLLKSLINIQKNQRDKSPNDEIARKNYTKRIIECKEQCKKNKLFHKEFVDKVRHRYTQNIKLRGSLIELVHIMGAYEKEKEANDKLNVMIPEIRKEVQEQTKIFDNNKSIDFSKFGSRLEDYMSKYFSDL